MISIDMALVGIFTTGVGVGMFIGGVAAMITFLSEKEN